MVTTHTCLQRITLKEKEKEKKSRVKILGNKFTLSLVTVQAACNSVVCYKVVGLSMGLWKLN